MDGGLNPDHPTRNRFGRVAAKSTIWTAEEDAALLELVQDPSHTEWAALSRNFPNKTSKQVSERWAKVLNPALKKGCWSADEDAILANFVRENGETQWTKCSQLLPGRIGKQCRERWFNALHPDLLNSPFTTQDDNLLIAAYGEFGSNWTRIAEVMRGRSANALKNRWHYLERTHAQLQRRPAPPPPPPKPASSRRKRVVPDENNAAHAHTHLNS